MSVLWITLAVLVGAAIVGGTAVFFLRARFMENTGQGVPSNLTTSAAPVPIAQEVKAIGEQIERAMAEQRLQGETQRQLLTQKLDGVRQVVDTQRNQVDGLRNEFQHEVKRRDAEMEDIRNQIATIRSGIALPEAPAPAALPPAPEDVYESEPAIEAPIEEMSSVLSESEWDSAAPEAAALSARAPGAAFDVDPGFGREAEIRNEPESLVFPQPQDVEVPADEFSFEPISSEPLAVETPADESSLAPVEPFSPEPEEPEASVPEEVAPEPSAFEAISLEAISFEAISFEAPTAKPVNDVPVEDRAFETNSAEEEPAPPVATADVFAEDAFAEESSMVTISLDDEAPLDEAEEAEPDFAFGTTTPPPATVSEVETQFESAPQSEDDTFAELSLAELQSVPTSAPPAEAPDEPSWDESDDPFATMPLSDGADETPTFASIDFSTATPYASRPETPAFGGDSDPQSLPPEPTPGSPGVFDPSSSSPTPEPYEGPAEVTPEPAPEPEDPIETNVSSPLEPVLFETNPFTFGPDDVAAEPAASQAAAEVETAPVEVEDIEERPLAETTWVARPDRPQPIAGAYDQTPALDDDPLIATPVVAPMEDFFPPIEPAPSAEAPPVPSTSAPLASASVEPMPEPEAHAAPEAAPEPVADATPDAEADEIPIPDGADDLTVISSVDDPTQRLLYRHGIHTLDEIARWGRGEARRVSGLVQVSEETIMNQWVFEAQAALFNQFAQQASR